jgi:hypothetical protein
MVMVGSALFAALNNQTGHTPWLSRYHFNAPFLVCFVVVFGDTDIR